MATRLEIERDKLKLVDTITDQVLAECASECTKIIQVIPLDDTYLVREDPEGFPVDRSNVYLLDSNLNRCWTAELPVPGDVYTEIRSFTGRIWAASRAGHFCTLSQATGVIFKRDWSRPVTSIQVTDLYHDLLRWKGFFDVAGGSILYCLSAMLILFGIVKIMGPILATQFDLTAILPPLVVMNVYELVLLGILIFVVVRLKIMDDAISLVILICLFLMANGITLDTVAIAGPKTVLYIGIACTILGLIKLEIIKRYIIPQLDRWFLAAGAVLMVWNFMAGPIIARHKMYMDSLHAFKREPWLWAWYAVLAAAVLAVVGATSAVCRTDEGEEMMDER